MGDTKNCSVYFKMGDNQWHDSCVILVNKVIMVYDLCKMFVTFEQTEHNFFHFIIQAKMANMGLLLVTIQR